MARSEQQKKKNSKIISAIIAIVLIVLILAASIFVIIDAIVNSIQGVIGAIMDSIINLFKDPLAWAQSSWAELEDWLKTSLIKWNANAPIGEFNTKAYEKYRIDPTIVISKDKFQEMKNSLDNMINRNIAGLDNLMLKKMMLAYYRGLYLDDTTVLIELGHEDLGLTEEQFKNIDTIMQLYAELEVLENELELNPNDQIKGMKIWHKKNEIIAKYKITIEQCKAIKEQLKPFSIIEGNKLKGIGENGKIYWQTRGMVTIYVGDAGEQKIIYYKADVLDLIYEKHYKAILKINTEEAINYANSVAAYLNKCYTYTENGITMYSTQAYVTTEKTIEYVNESQAYNEYKDSNKEKEGNIVDWFFNIFSKEDKNEQTGVVRQLTPTTIKPVEAQYPEFSTKVAQYATPMEFMVEMLEITASKDFINDFIEMVGEETSIKLRLYEIVNQEVQNTIEEKERTTTISGERTGEYTAQVVRKGEKRNNGKVKEWYPVEPEGFGEAPGGVVFDGDTPCVYVTIVNNKESFQKDYKYEVELKYDGEKVDSKEFDVIAGYDSTTIRFDEGIQPGKTDKIDTSKVIETETVTTYTNQYDIAIAEVKTWYGTFIPTNYVDTTITVENLKEVVKKTNRLPGGQEIFDSEEVEEVYKEIYKILDAQELDTSKIYEELIKANNLVTSVTYTWPETQTIEKEENEKIFENKDLEDVIWKEYDDNKAEDTDGDDDFFGGYSENYCLNVLYNYVTQRGEGKGESSNYKYNIMKNVDNKRNKVSVILTYNEVLKEGLDGGTVQVARDYTPFLNLLGEYDDLYGGKANIGELLVNGSEMLYELLASNGRTEGLVQVMKYALYEYSNDNSEINIWGGFNIYDENNYIPIE